MPTVTTVFSQTSHSLTLRRLGRPEGGSEQRHKCWAQSQQTAFIDSDLKASGLYSCSAV